LVTPDRNVFDRGVRLAVAAYILFLCCQVAFTFSPNVHVPWFNKSDENVVVAEVIRFSNRDFQQRFYDMPGTPLMLFGAGQWVVIYLWSLLMNGLHGGINLDGGINLFSFQHLQQLFVLLRIDNIFFFLLSALFLFRIVSRAANVYAGAVAVTVLLMNEAYAETAASLRVEPLAMCFMLAAVLVITECPWTSAPFWAGLLGGLAAACRLHSITATLPILVLLLLSQSRGHLTQYPARVRRIAGAFAGALFPAAALFFYFFRWGPSPLKAKYPLAFALIAKACLVLCILIAIVVLLYFVKRSRPAIVNAITPAFLSLIGGIAMGTLLGAPTIFTQYECFLRSLDFYLGNFKDGAAMHLPFVDKAVSFVIFYMKAIAPDYLTLALLILGASLVLLLPRWRVLWPYLAVAMSFFFSKPLDLTRATHHVALWIPFYALLCSIPIAAVCEALDARGRVGRYIAASVAVLTLLALHVEVKNGPAEYGTKASWDVERLHNIELSRTWIRANTEKDATFMIAFYCFGPEVFYSIFREMGLNVPISMSDPREYDLWWEKRSDIKRNSGFACMSPFDVPFMKEFELRKAGEGMDPLHDDRFHLVQSFGQGANEILLLRFDMSAVGKTGKRAF
jgi:hypothetical protein